MLCIRMLTLLVSYCHYENDLNSNSSLSVAQYQKSPKTHLVFPVSAGRYPGEELDEDGLNPS